MLNTVIANVATSIPISSLDPVIQNADVDALFQIEDLWSEIQKALAVSLSFVQHDRSVWAVFENRDSELVMQKPVPESFVPSVHELCGTSEATECCGVQGVA
jgi:hypothetical protein